MQKFLRIGEKLSRLKIQGADIGEFNIVVHTSGSLRGVGVMPAAVEKAAKIIQKYVAALTDVTVPVIFDNYPAHSGKEIAIGGVNREYDCTNKEAYEPDEYEIRTAQGNLLINGGVRGVLYGAYTFLEDYLGVRFFTRTIERVKYEPVIEICEINERFNPPFAYRELCHWNIFDSDFTVKSKINGTFARKLRDEDGYGVGFAGGFAGLVHTFSLFCPPDELFETHPEYFAADENGNRVPYALCFTNKDTQKIVAKNMIACLDKEIAPTMISLSINDGVDSRCCCGNCRNLFGGKGNETDRLLYFVNKVAGKIAKKYPHVNVDTISYADMSEPPKRVKPAENVVIRVCANGARNITLYETEEIAESGDEKTKKPFKSKIEFIDRLKKLAGITGKIYVWDYPYNYKVVNAVFPVLHTIREDMRFFAEHNVKGVYINGQTDTCDFDDLKIYLLAKAMFRPYMSAEEYERHYAEFLQGFYGAGWKNIDRYIKSCEKIGRKTNFGCHSDPDEIIPCKRLKNGGYDCAFIDSSRRKFENALKRAGTAGEKRRIEKNALQIDYYELYTAMNEQTAPSANPSEQTLATYRQKNEKLYRSFLKFGITRVVENTFLPIVKDFDQSPNEWDYWDEKCVAGDRNNESCEREMYIMLPFCSAQSREYGAEDRVDISFAYRTNNENERGFVSVYKDENTRIRANWRDGFGEFTKLRFYGVQPLTKKEFSRIARIDENDVRINLLPIHLRGAILRIERIDSGAYAFIRNLKIERRY